MSFIKSLFGFNRESNNLKEAEPTGCSYEIIKGFVNQIESKIDLRGVFDLKQILSGLGCKINYICLEDWNNKKFNFLNIFSKNNFSVNVCEGFPEDINRILFAQALGGYLIHSQSGNKPCCIKDAYGGDVSKEMLFFALNLLMSDESFVQLKKSGMGNEEISNMYRVPIQLIETKENILKKFSLL